MIYSFSSKEFEDNYTYSGNDLGAVWTEAQTCFRLWAPLVSKASVVLYQSGTAGTDDQIKEVPMQRDEKGTWTAAAEGNLNGIYYTYRIVRNGQTLEVCDPYARTTGVNGNRAMVIDLNSTNPAGWDTDCDPNAGLSPTDCVIYELHLRDLSCAPGSGIKHKGKYLGLAERGTKYQKTYPTGLDHIRDMGVTHIHLLPIYDFGSVDESNLDANEFNWGYDPVNYNVPEGSFSTNPFDGFSRVRELKQMIHTLHQNGLSVIMDVVYNHVYHTDEFTVNQITPGYFSRENDRGFYSNGSGCGNDTASERSMVRKYIVDSVNYWAEQYHIDGFRFDLVGLIDTQTINEIIETVHSRHPNVLFYGEGWDIPTNVTKQGVSLTTQYNAGLVPQFAFFNDTIRDTMRGSVFDYHQPGYISGANVSKDHLMNCFSGRNNWSRNPKQIINYISCHDNHTLYDRIAVTLPKASPTEIAQRSRLAAAFNLLSVGIPFFQAGEEMLRTKKIRKGVYIGNSYRSPDKINSIKWKALKEDEVRKTVDFYKGLISLRKKHRLLRIDNASDAEHRISSFATDSDFLTAFLLSDSEESILIAFHSGTAVEELQLPAGKWEINVLDASIYESGLNIAEDHIPIPPLSAFLAVRKSE